MTSNAGSTFLAVAALLVPRIAMPQDAPDRAAILAQVDRHFAGMKARDTAMRPRSPTPE